MNEVSCRLDRIRADLIDCPDDLASLLEMKKWTVERLGCAIALSERVAPAAERPARGNVVSLVGATR